MRSRKNGVLVVKETLFVVLAFATLATLTVIAYQNHRRFHQPLLTTPYQAVTLTNGSVFYGRIDHLGSDHPVLRNAFSLRHEQNAETQQPSHVLVRREDELTGADHMIFPVTSIAFVEPVHADSIVGRLIEQTGLQRPAP
jgi:hypothetical protein